MMETRLATDIDARLMVLFEQVYSDCADLILSY